MHSIVALDKLSLKIVKDNDGGRILLILKVVIVDDALSNLCVVMAVI